MSQTTARKLVKDADGLVEIDGSDIALQYHQDGYWSITVDFVDDDENIDTFCKVTGTEYAETASSRKYTDWPEYTITGTWNAIKQALIAYEGCNFATEKAATFNNAAEPV